MITILAASTYEALQDDDGLWYVNQYFRKSPEDVLRRETLVEGLTHTGARAFVKDFNALSENAEKIRTRALLL